jgi:hypothetical protein
MMWNYVKAGILTWKDLERLKKILSASAFSLYYSLPLQISHRLDLDLLTCGC